MIRVRTVAGHVGRQHSLRELSKQAADELPVLDVALAQPAGRHAADVPVILDQQDRPSQARGGDGRGNAARRRPEHDDVGGCVAGAGWIAIMAWGHG